jgi:hypothetical protein
MFDIIITIASFVFGGLFCIMLLMMLFSPLYFIWGFGKRFYHDILGWHMPKDKDSTFNGCSLCNHCKYCGKHIMQDSQGNWF